MTARIGSSAIIAALIALSASAQSWTQLDPFTGSSRSGTAGFTIGNFAYMVGGRDTIGADLKECWSYLPTTGHWLQKASLPEGQERRYACGFSGNGSGYVCCGVRNSSTKFNNLWRFDPSDDLWSQHASLPGDPRYGAYCFVLGGIAYIGGGTATNAAAGPFLSDLYAYDMENNLWSSRSGLPGQGLFAASAFTVGDTAYVFGGRKDDLNYSNELWRYVPASDTWTQMTSMPAQGRIYAMAWGGATQGIVAGGQFDGAVVQDAMLYRPASDAWYYAPPYPGAAGSAAFCFSMNESIYAGPGNNGGVAKKELWVLAQDLATELQPVMDADRALSLLPNVCGPEAPLHLSASDEVLRSIKDVRVFDVLGNQVMERSGPPGISLLPLPALRTGRYMVSVVFDDDDRRTLPLTITQ